MRHTAICDKEKKKNTLIILLLLITPSQNTELTGPIFQMHWLNEVLTCRSGAAREGGAAAPFALFFRTRLLQSLQTVSTPAFVEHVVHKLGEDDAGPCSHFCREQLFLPCFYVRLWCRLVVTTGFRSVLCGEREWQKNHKGPQLTINANQVSHFLMKL